MKTKLILLIFLLFVSVGTLYAEDAEFTCDQNIEDFWNREYDNLTITLDERCDAKSEKRQYYAFKGISAKHIDCIDKQNAATQGCYVQFFDSKIESMRYEHFNTIGGIHVLDGTELEMLDLYTNTRNVFISGTEESYQYITDYIGLPKGHIGTLNFYTQVLASNKGGNYLGLYGMIVGKVNVIPLSEYADEARFNLTDSRFDLLYTPKPVELLKYLPAGLTEDSRFMVNVGTMVVETDKVIPIITDGIHMENLVVLGKNRNIDGGVNITDKNYAIFDNIVLLGSNMTFTNYLKYSGKPAIGSLYVANLGLDMDGTKEVVENSENVIEGLLYANQENTPADVSVPYYVTLNYTNLENVYYSQSIPEPNIVRNNESYLLGNIEQF